MDIQQVIYTERFIKALLGQPGLYVHLPYYPPRPFDAYEKYAFFKPFSWWGVFSAYGSPYTTPVIT